MTKRFSSDGWSICDGEHKIGMIQASKLLNDLQEETQDQEVAIKRLNCENVRLRNRNRLMSKDFDRLTQHLIDMNLMTEEEILKVIE